MRARGRMRGRQSRGGRRPPPYVVETVDFEPPKEAPKSLDESDIPEERYFLNPNSVSRHLFCSICQEVFDDPYRAPCGHSFCKKCIMEWMKNSSTCPEDRKRMTFGQMHHDFILENIIGDYQVACPWRALGCFHVGPLCTLKGHKGSCTFNPKAMPEVLQKYSKDILKKTTNEMMQRSLASAIAPKPASPPAASEVRQGMLDLLIASIPDSEVAPEAEQGPSSGGSAPTESSLPGDVASLSDDEADHLPEAPAMPSLRMRLYLSGNVEERSSLCDFLETTESLSSTSKDGPMAKRRAL